MRIKRKSFLKSGKLLCHVLAVLLAIGAATSTPGAGAMQSEELEAASTPGEEVTQSQEPETTPAPGEETTQSPEPEDATYANSISGMLWIDTNTDGVYDSGEQPLADYPVYLYLEGDTDNTVDTVTTDAEGKYLFEDMEPGRYVVGIKAEENGTEYLLPMVGVQQDNKFYFTSDYSKVISNPIDIAADTVVTDIDAGMRTVPGKQSRAVYNLSAGAVTIAAGSGNHTITGTYTGTATAITVQAGYTGTITLQNVDITSTSSFGMLITSGANVNLVLDGTNVVKGETGIAVPAGAEITISGTGSLDATGGGLGPGIGYTDFGPDVGIITINSGTITAIGGGGAAGIGGGFDTDSGTITINGGTVTAIGIGGGAGIGSGHNEDNLPNNGTITINGGTVTAIAGSVIAYSGAAGIGGGSQSGSGTITITGGTITATGGSATGDGGAGIGAGAGCGGISSSITISGGTVIATGDVGIGIPITSSSVNTAIVFTSGSIYPTNSSGVSVDPDPTNGVYGLDIVYMNTVTVVDEGGSTVAGATVIIPATGSSGTYTYTATTNSSGIAYVWVPVGNHTFQGQLGTAVGSTDSTVPADNSNSLTILLRSPRTVTFVPNGGTPAPAPQTLFNGDLVTEPATMTRIGYQFIDWYDNASFSGAVWNFTTDTISGDTTLYAKWLNVSVNATLKYEDRSGAQVRANNTVSPLTEGSAYTPSVSDKTVANYVLVDWKLDGEAAWRGNTNPSITVPSSDFGIVLLYGRDNGTSGDISGGGSEIPNGVEDIDVLRMWQLTDGTPIASLPNEVQIWDVGDTFNRAHNSGVVIPSGIVYVGYKLDTDLPSDPLHTGAPNIAITVAGGNRTVTYVYQPSYTITEKHVDQSGNTLLDASSTPIPDTTQSVTPGAAYNGSAASIADYVCIGYKIGSSTDTFATATPGTIGDTSPTIASVSAEHTVWFIYAKTEGSIKIEKYAHGGTSPLPGAEFKLEKLDTSVSPAVVDTTFTAQSLTTGASGSVTFPVLPAGSYKITETAAPSGYDLLTEPFRVDVPYDLTLPSGQTPADSNYLYSTTSGGNITYHYYDVTYKVSDQASITMPTAGTTGTLPPYTLWGGLTMLVAACGGGLLLRKHRSKHYAKHVA